MSVSIFISHAINDKTLIQKIVSFIQDGMGVTEEANLLFFSRWLRDTKVLIRVDEPIKRRGNSGWSRISWGVGRQTQQQ